jgi:AcrR family transcriptional regulator
VIEQAGVAKASLYNTFGSKEELIRAYLLARHETRIARLDEKLAQLATPTDRILAVFDDQREIAAQQGFRGCAFVRASAELGNAPGVREVCVQSRAWLLGLFAQLASDAGVRDPLLVARQLIILYDGAAVSGQMDGVVGASQAAREMAVQLLRAGGKA